MRRWGNYIMVLCFATLAVSCTGIEQNSSLLPGAAVATSTPTYSCSDYAEYSDYNNCKFATGAQCDSEWRTFPSGGVSLCYKPVSGWEACTVRPRTWDWIYTSWGSWCNAQQSDASGLSIFKRFRSIINCSSDTCICEEDQATEDQCTMGGGSAPCGFTLTATPTPANCP